MLGLGSIMPKFLVPRGAKVAIAICDRCHTKKAYTDLRPDGNSPGLRVCADCWDIKDPWRLAPLPAETISLRFARPDEKLDP